MKHKKKIDPDQKDICWCPNCGDIVYQKNMFKAFFTALVNIFGGFFPIFGASLILGLFILILVVIIQGFINKTYVWGSKGMAIFLLILNSIIVLVVFVVFLAFASGIISDGKDNVKNAAKRKCAYCGQELTNIKNRGVYETIDRERRYVRKEDWKEWYLCFRFKIKGCDDNVPNIYDYVIDIVHYRGKETKKELNARIDEMLNWIVETFPDKEFDVCLRFGFNCQHRFLILRNRLLGSKFLADKILHRFYERPMFKRVGREMSIYLKNNDKSKIENCFVTCCWGNDFPKEQDESKIVKLTKEQLVSL